MANGNGRQNDYLAPKEPKGEQAAERELTGRPLTLGYRPSRGVNFYGGSGSRFETWRMLYDIEDMVVHPDVVQPYDYYKAGIASVKFKVKARNTAEAEEAHKLLTKFWSEALELAQETGDYGWGAFEPYYRVRKGLLEWRGMESTFPLDATALVRGGRLVGAAIRGGTGSEGGDNKDGTIKLRAPGRYPGKLLWLMHRRRWDRFYGRSQLIGPWRPWRRLATRDGAEEVIDMGFYRFAYKGPVVRFPSGSFRKKGGGEMDYDAARTESQLLAEQAKAGVSLAMPSDRDVNGNYLWDLEFPEAALNLAPLLEYEKGLQVQIARGIGVPPELLQASETGSGWSGRKVPLLGFYQTQLRNARNLTRAVVTQLAQPVLRWNHGPLAWCEAEVELDLPAAVAGEQPGGQGGSPAPQPGGAQKDPAQGLLPAGDGEEKQLSLIPQEVKRVVGEALAEAKEEWARRERGVEMARVGAEPPAHKFSSTQFDLPEGVAARVREMAARVADADLAEDGREERPHVTVKYGLLTDGPEAIRSLLAGVAPVTVRLGRTSLFPADESGPQRGGDAFDVVKIDVDGDSLRALNKLLSSLPHKDTHPTYQPHVTLAYVKPGRGKKYVGMADLDGATLTLDGLVFSDRERNETVIRLAEAAPDLAGEAYFLARRILHERRRGVELASAPDEEGPGPEPDAPPPDEEMRRWKARGWPVYRDDETGQWLIGDQPDLPEDEGFSLSGFTGEIKDSLGRRRRYVDGKQVAIEENAPKAKREAQKAQEAEAQKRRLAQPPRLEGDFRPGERRHAAAEAMHLGDHAALHALVGAQPGAVVRAWGQGGNKISFSVDHPAVKTQSRTLWMSDDGKLVCNNEMFFLKKAYRGGGMGSKVFTDQVQALLDIGADEIRTMAGKGGIMNGYYTWPRLGYDAPLTGGYRGKLKTGFVMRALNKAGVPESPELYRRAQALIEAGPKTVLDLMATEDGRSLWKQTGYMTEMTFDLRPGSRSLQVLNEYRAGKGLPPIEAKAPAKAEALRQARKQSAAPEEKLKRFFEG